MFCPKCAAELVRRDGELRCVAGEMGLSQHVEQVLTERYASHAASREEARQPQSRILGIVLAAECCSAEIWSARSAMCRFEICSTS